MNKELMNMVANKLGASKLTDEEQFRVVCAQVGFSKYGFKKPMDLKDEMINDLNTFILTKVTLDLGFVDRRKLYAILSTKIEGIMGGK